MDIKSKFSELKLTYIVNISLIIITFWISVIDEIVNNNISEIDYLSGEKVYLFILNISLFLEIYLLDYDDIFIYKIQAVYNFSNINILLYIGSFIKFQNIFGNSILQIYNLILFIFFIIKTIYSLIIYFKEVNKEKNKGADEINI